MSEIEIVGIKDTHKTIATDLEMFRKLLDEIEPATTSASSSAASTRMTWNEARSSRSPVDHPHTEFEAQVYILSKEEGGRHTPFFDGYRPQFYFRTTDVTGQAHLPEGVEMVMPGDNVEMKVDLIAPIAMEGASASRSARAAAPWVRAGSSRS